MYINKIDDLLDRVIDDFYNTVIIKDKIFKKLLNEVNFVKYQKEINEIFINYIKTLDIDEIRKLVKNEDTVQIIINIIKRYVAIYLFLTIGIFYKGTEDTFINNIVEFTKNQPNYGFKIENFFNSENNANVIKYNQLIGRILTIVNTEQNKLSNYLNKPEYKDAITLLNTLGQDYVDHAFKLEYLNNNANDQAHNIIKTIIILLIYKKTEKENVFRILESIESEQGEYMFIDIVIPRKQVINFGTVENLLSKKDLIRGLAYEFWNFITEQEENIKMSDITVDEKIIRLINSKILIPITDDFLMYHKDTERYDKAITDPTKVKKKEDTKIRYIVTKIDRVSEYYSETVQKDPKLKAEIKKLFYVPLADRKAVLYNNNEEIKIINKLLNLGRRSIESNEYYNDLIHYRKYPYINFKEFKDYGFSIMLNRTIDIVRGTTFEFESKERSNIQLRIGSDDQIVNVIGFMIPSNVRPLGCLKARDVTSIRTLSKTNTNGYDLIYKYLQQSSLNLKKHKSSAYWLFDLKLDKVVMDTYEQFTKLNNQDQVKYMISKLYDDILDEVFYEINDKLNSYKTIALKKSFDIVKSIERRSLVIPRDSNLFSRLEEKIFYEKHERQEPKYDINEDKFFGLSGDVIKLIRIPDRKPPPIQTVRLDVAKITQKERTEEQEEILGICQHNISWAQIMALRKKDPNRYTNMLYAFIEKYVIESSDHEYVCKSCGFQLNIKKFITDGVYDDEADRFITFSTPMDVPLEDIPEYEKYIIAIRNIDKLIERVATISNIPYFLGSAPTIRWRRKGVTKDLIDLLIMHNNILKKNFKERNVLATKLYGVSRELSNLFVFDLDNNIFIYSSKEKDYFKNVKHNNVIAYMIILMILEVNDSHITFMSGDKKGFCNFPIFEKVGNMLFDGLKIRKNKAGDLTDLKKYKVLCYMLYIISCLATRYHLWHYEFPTEAKTAKERYYTEKAEKTDVTSEDKTLKIVKPKPTSKKQKFDPKIQKIIIHTIVDVLNSILEVSSSRMVTGTKGEEKTIHRLYEIISTKFFRKMRDTYGNENIINMFKSNERSSISTERKDFIFTRINNIPLMGIYSKPNYDVPYWRKCVVAKYFVKSRSMQDLKEIFEHLDTISNLTNCPSGEFHNWAVKGKIFICTRCGTEINVVYDDKLTAQVRKNFKYVGLQKLARKYCADGTLHNYLYSDEKSCSICSKCKLSETYEFTHEELDKLEQNVSQHKFQTKLKNEQELKEIENQEKKEQDYETQVIDKVKNNICVVAS